MYAIVTVGSQLTNLRYSTLYLSVFRNEERLRWILSYQLQIYYFNEIQRGLCQSGDYRLSSHFAYCARDPTEVQLIESVCPHDIVDRVQAQQAIHIENGEFDPDKKIVHEEDKHPSSKIARANLILTENRLSYDPKLGVFVVRKSEGKHNAVTLFPK